MGQSLTEVSAGSPEAIEVFLKASSALLTSTSLDNTLSIIVQLADRLFSADAAAIWRIESGAVRLVTSLGLSDEYTSRPELRLRGDISTLEDMVIADVQSDPRVAHLRDRYAAEGVQSLLVMALTEGARDFGTLTLYYKAPHAFDENDRMAARTLANLSSAAITAAALAEREARQRDALAQALEATRRAEARLRLINNAGLIFNESLDYNLTLDNLTKAIVPELADWCAVHLLEGQELRQVALAHTDQEKLAWAKQMQQRYPSARSSKQGVYEVVRSGQTQLKNQISDEALARLARDAEHLALLRRIGIGSYICVPLRTRSAVIGTLSLVRSEPDRPYDTADREVIEELGRRAGLAVEKARLYEESQSARAALERSNQAKDEFLGMVSHELRTPLTAIFGSVHLLLSRWGLLAEEDREELLQSVKAESTRMIDLVENLLTLARLELVQAADETLIDVPEFLATLPPPFGAAPRPVQLDYRARLSSIRAPESLLRQVLTNLVGNADKYSPPGLPVEIMVEDQDDGLVFRVLDRGPGVDPAELGLIFESFHRARATAHLPGKGLGLSLSRRIVEALGGRIWATPRQGGGLEVAFYLPARTGPATKSRRSAAARAPAIKG